MLKAHLKPSLLLYDYIIRGLIYPFVAGVIFITFILMMFQILRLTNFAIVHGVSFNEVIRILFYMSVSFIPIAIPISFLFSVLFVFGQMSTDNEMIALRAAGFSLKQIFIPVFVIAILISAFGLRVSLFEGPNSYTNFKEILHQISSKTVSLSIKPGFFNTEMIDGVTFYAEKVEANKLTNVFIYDGRDPDMKTTIFAKNGHLNIDNVTSQTVMSLENGRAILGEKKFSVMDFKNYDILLFKGSIPSILNARIHFLNINQLKDRIKQNPTPKLLTEYYKRFAMPLSCLIFAFIGLLFGNFSSRTGRSVGLISFLFVLIYWVFYILGVNLGTKNILNPFIGAWLSNIIFILMGTIYWWKRRFSL